MQSTGQTSTHAVSLVPMHGSAITYAIQRLLLATADRWPSTLKWFDPREFFISRPITSNKQLKKLYAGAYAFSTVSRRSKIEKEGKRMRMRTAFVVVVLMAAAAVMAAPQTKAPGDPQLIDAQGYQKLLSQYRGKPVLMTFWATWCEPCRDEYPMLNELAKQYAPKGLKVVGVNFDQDGDLILMRRFMARYKPVFPNYRRKPGEEEPFRQAVLPGWNGSL